MHRAARPLAIALALLLSASPGAAQPPAAPPGPATTRTVNLSVEQRHIIRELLRENGQSSSELKIGRGETVPPQVELRAIPPLLAQKVPTISAHRFFLAGDRIVLVEPQDRIVAEVID